MTTDPVLQALFDDSKAETIENGFTENVMSEVEKSRRKTIAVWIGISLPVLLLLWWVTGPVLGLLDLVSELLPVSLFDVGESRIAQFLAPLNSVAALLAACGFVLYAGFRKIFS